MAVPAIGAPVSRADPAVTRFRPAAVLQFWASRSTQSKSPGVAAGALSFRCL